MGHMFQSAPFKDEALSAAPPAVGTRAPESAWTRVKLIALRSIFWPYDRGSWQYDIICAVILAFIFLTPVSWFHDRPTLGLTNLRHAEGVIQLGHAPDGWHYLIDARLVSSLAPLKPSDAIREILRRRLHQQIGSEEIGVLRDRSNVVLGYTVVLHR